DNTSDVHMVLEGSCVIIRVTSQSLRTLIATCDDLLINLQIASEALTAV
ncbi:MAG: KEOPS complex subunit Pcc1, partial [Halobacteriota archaeon]